MPDRRTRPDPDPEPPLGDRLVRVALELLAEEGVDALTLRSVARRAGVSHGAPARHFRNLADLLAEVAAVGFRMLSEAIEKSDASIPRDAEPITRLAAAGRAYRDCALANPGLFALMFRTSVLDENNEALTRDSNAAFEGLLGHIRRAQADGWHPDRDPRLLAGAMWASIHGLATLWAEGAYQKAVPTVSIDDATDCFYDLFDDPTRGIPNSQGESK